MTIQTHPSHGIVESIASLPPQLQEEVVHYIDYLKQRYTEAKQSEALSLFQLRRAWDEDDDGMV